MQLYDLISISQIKKLSDEVSFSGEFKKKKIWESLPRGVMYQTFCIIFNYLIESKKIARDSENKIAWIWNPKLVEKYLSKPNLMWKK